MREGTGAVGEPPRRMEGAAQSESRERKEAGSWEAQTAWSAEIRANPEPQTSNPGRAAGPVLVYFHFITF